MARESTMPIARAVSSSRRARPGASSARSAGVPPYDPQLASLVAAAPEGDDWLHEVKFDGFRMGLTIEAGRVRLTSRNGLDWSVRFPTLIEAAASLPLSSALLDGEVALLLRDGRTSFQALQNTGRGQGELVYFLFDLLWVDGEDLSPRSLEDRKARLKSILPRAKSPLRYSDHVIGNGPRAHAEACRAGYEGIISKRRDAPSSPGRSRTWVKVKCLGRQEFVIGGFTEPQGSREGLGALLIGHHDRRRLVYAGKVGTGFTVQAARDLRARLEPLVQDASPFSPAPRGADVRGAHWVRPELVAEVAFTEWTDAGRIRHPSFQGLRDDKRAADVVREQPRATTAAAPKRRRGSAIPARRAAAAATSTPATSSSRDARVVVRGVSVSNPQRVMYPDAGITKLDLVRYMDDIAEWMVPHVADRPLSFVFCPDGITGECAYLKHGKTWGPKTLRRVRIREKTKVGEYMVADTAEGLVAMMQMNWIEIHTWNSTVEHLEQPNRLVFDLDPGPDVRWPQVVAAAKEARDLLTSAGLSSWLKTTGGKGLHVVAPLVPEASWGEGLAFAEGIASALVRSAPRRYTTQFAKAGREALILVDVLRNNRGSTAVSAYSPRARAGATISTPLAWDELSARRRPDRFTVKTVPARLRALAADPWQDYWTCVQRLPGR